MHGVVLRGATRCFVGDSRHVDEGSRLFVALVGALCDINAMLMYSNGLCSACRRERALKKSALVHQ